MVLQRNIKIPVWGNASPGRQVKIDFDGKTYKTITDKPGKWKIYIDEHNLPCPYQMKVYSDSNSVTFNDILIGEVWICGGQSNMEWAVLQSNNSQQEISNAKYSNIRLCKIDRLISEKPVNDIKTEWKECSPETVEQFSAVGYFFGRDLYNDINVPIGLIESVWGGTPIEAWTSREVLEKMQEFSGTMKKNKASARKYYSDMAEYEQLYQQWQTQGAKELPPKTIKDPRHRWPSVLFNGMIYPIIPYAFRGVIWYQGEGNAGRACQYKKLFPALIKDWRTRWGIDDFPFLFVQLASFRNPSPVPVENEWAELREAQIDTLSLPNTGMALAIDIGEANSIHPKNKQDVGKRLCLIALEKVYGKKVISNGLMYNNMQVNDNKVILSFDHIYDGLKFKDDRLLGFSIAGVDKKFKWAQAEIKDNKIVVWSDEIKNPVAVRYSWESNPNGNLYNSADLPACPFRTDNFKLSTFSKQ
ncbi:MAG: hypothetical protein A2Y10_11865 [Planctomycetes bacterium GWF2_41_51]|nr:MAG: hypothetical protein A2Y10_11865 [Planctomycetes bacterium GWF2_41_51]HBG28642.1 sialate O-acetylesterase [Phycisphaerales bacterium]